MMKEQEIKEKIKDITLDILESTGLIKVIREDTDLGYAVPPNLRFKPDIVFEVEIKKNRYFLVFEIKSTGQPRYIRMMASQLKSAISEKSDYYGVIGTVFVSRESREICKEQGIGFVDLSGNCLFQFDNVYIKIEGKLNLYPSTRPLKSLFAIKATRALRVLLCNPQKEWFVKDLAAEANISLGQASNLKKKLLEYEFIKEMNGKRRSKFQLANPQALLNKWADNYNYRVNKIRNFYSFDDVRVIEKKLADYCSSNQISYAFSLTSGTARVAPFLRYGRAFYYVIDSIDKIALDLELKDVSSGPTISLLEPYDKGVFYGMRQVQGVMVVSDAQLYLDLKNYKERGEEAANFLLENSLKKQW